MDTQRAVMMAQANTGNPIMVFDWHQAARLIKERKPKTVRAGLSSDWEWTGGYILKDGEPVLQKDGSGRPYLASNWATPEIEIDGEIISCMKLKHEPPEPGEWDAETQWPESALEILKK